MSIIVEPLVPATYRGEAAGKLTLQLSNASTPPREIRLFADAELAQGCKLTAPDEIDLGIVPWGRTVERQVVIESVGACACTISKLHPEDGADEGPFDIILSTFGPAILPGVVGCPGDPAPTASTFAENARVHVEVTAPEYDQTATYSSSLSLESSDPTAPTLIPILATVGAGPWCDLEVSPKRLPEADHVDRYGVLDFGEVPAHTVKELPIELYNAGLAPCHITAIEWDAEFSTAHNEFHLEYEGGSHVVMGPQDIEVPPGQTARFLAVFAPTRAADHVYRPDTLDLETNESLCFGLDGRAPYCNGVRFVTDDMASVTDWIGAEATGAYSIGFRGAAVSAAVEVQPHHISFGKVPVACEARRTITVYSRGSHDLLVHNPVLIDSSSAGFVLGTPHFALPLSLPRGESTTIEVAYVPTTEGGASGALRIPTGPEGAEVTVIPLEGSGTTLMPIVEAFDQPANPRTDFLVVLDTSGSMWDHNDTVAPNRAGLVDAIATSVDYRIAVTPTLFYDYYCEGLDTLGLAMCSEHGLAGHNTTCPGNERFLTPETEAPATKLACATNTWGVIPQETFSPFRPRSNLEAPMAAAWRFFSQENLSDPARNGGIIRDDADLHVVIVSDARDLSPPPLDLYVNFFRDLKGPGRASRVRVSAVGEMPGTCVSEHVPLGNGVPLPDVVDAMSGQWGFICEPDWTPFWTAIAEDALQQKRRFYLSGAADPATLSVCVRATGLDDPVCAPASAGVDYTYDADERMLVFEPGSVPPDGARVEVTYEPACSAP